MNKEIKFTDKAIKQINNLLVEKAKGSFLESLLKVVVAQVSNMISLLTIKQNKMT